MKVKDIDKLMEQLHNDKREAFSKHEVWLMLSEHNTKVPTVDVDPPTGGGSLTDSDILSAPSVAICRMTKQQQRIIAHTVERR